MAVLDLQVGASADDDLARRQTSTLWTAGGSHSRVGNVNSSFYAHGGSSRFTNVTVPNAATIDVAYLTLTPSSTISTATCIGTLAMEDADNPGQMSSYADHTGRIRTADIAWNPIPTFTLDVAINSPSLVNPIQTVANRAGWASGQAMIVFLEDRTGASSVGASRTWNPWDFSTTKAAKLHIEYTAGGGTTVTPTTLALVLTSFAPSIVVGTVVAPPTLALAITAYAPSMIIGTIITPPTLALTLTTFEPTLNIVPIPSIPVVPFAAVPWYPIWGRLQYASVQFSMYSWLSAHGSILRDGVAVLGMTGTVVAKAHGIAMASAIMAMGTGIRATSIQRLSLAKLRQQEREMLIAHFASKGLGKASFLIREDKDGD